MNKKNFTVAEHADSRLGEKYLELKHISGLSVYVFPKDRQSCCAILACEYGSIDSEFEGENGKMIKVPDGIAHFLEHKMFENNEGGSVEETFSALGADPNAFTKWDATAYFFTCGSGENFYPCLDELIDFVMTPSFTDESVEKEKGIIGQEILMCEDDPYDRCFLNLVGGLYAHNPVRIDVAGTVRSIADINADLLRLCHSKFYTPANMVLIVCGDIDTERVLSAVDSHFSAAEYQSSGKPVRATPSDTCGVYKNKVSIDMTVERPMFCLGFKDDKAPEDSVERRKREILAEILVGLIFSTSGDLYNDLYKRGIMTTPFTYGEEYGKTYSFVYAGGECDDPDTLLSEILSAIDRMKAKGVDRKDFERRKRMTYSSDIKLYDSTWDIASAMLDDALAGVELFGEAERIVSLTADDGDRLLCELFCEDNMTFSVVLPKKDNE